MYMRLSHQRLLQLKLHLLLISRSHHLHHLQLLSQGTLRIYPSILPFSRNMILLQIVLETLVLAVHAHVCRSNLEQVLSARSKARHLHDLDLYRNRVLLPLPEQVVRLLLRQLRLSINLALSIQPRALRQPLKLLLLQVPPSHPRPILEF